MQPILPPQTDDFEWLAFEQTGVFTTAQGAALLGPETLRSRLRQQRWRRICRGIVLAENGQLRRDQQLWVAVLVAGAEARLAGKTAAAAGGVAGLATEPIEVLIPAARGRSTRLPVLPPDMAAVRMRRTTIMPAGHCQDTRPPRTTVARSVIDGAAWARHDDEARDLIARACQQRRVTIAQLREVLDRFPRIRRHRLIKTTIADAEGGAAALSEIDLLALCRRFRLPKPNLQQRRLDEDGRNRYLDAHWPEAHLLVEVDGAHHLDVASWTADMIRQNKIWIAGDRILRFPAALIRSAPATVAAQISAALNAVPRPPRT
jgi:hypothetical protein